jgi:tRNA-2-methylthio-N6-dimethylallyladenosine synthase
MKTDKNFYIETFGCQMNEFDSERLIFLLEGNGFTRTKNINSAGLVIINTCSVRKKAENRLYGHIGNLKILKNKNPGLIICICGCTAQNLKDKIQGDFPFVDIVFGTGNISRFLLILEKRLKTGRIVCDTSGTEISSCGSDFGLLPEVENLKTKPKSLTESNEDSYLDASRSFRFKAFIPVTVGCNNFCSYCIVPYVRGKERSVNPHKVLDKIKNLVESDGVVEVTLLGQNVNSYGLDFKNQQYITGEFDIFSESINFAKLLESIATLNGLKRIRFMTSHPKDFSDELIRVISENKNIMKHIHLPIQAGSDKILRLMNRKYTLYDYLLLYEKIKTAMPDCAITTDIIVGFPGEQEKDFSKTLETVQKLRFNRAFTFLYSPRQGTAAEKLTDEVLLSVKKKWFSELIRVQKMISFEENLLLAGKKFEVLVEGNDIKQKGLLKGRLENNNIVHFYSDNPEKMIGKFVSVKITETKSFYLNGELTEK